MCDRGKDKMEYETETSRILQIMPAEGFRAVYGTIQEDGKTVDLDARPLAGFALVEDEAGGRSVVGLDPRDIVYLCGELGDHLGYLPPGEKLTGEAEEEFRKMALSLHEVRADSRRRSRPAHEVCDAWP